MLYTCDENIVSDDVNVIVDFTRVENKLASNTENQEEFIYDIGVNNLDMRLVGNEDVGKINEHKVDDEKILAFQVFTIV